MPYYEYKCEVCENIETINHSIKEDARKKIFCTKCDKEQPCRRLISQTSEPLFKGKGWTVKQSGFGKRGYKGKYQNLIRDKGAPVDAPSDKAEADREFQRWVDTGGLQGIKPTIDTKNRDIANRPATMEEKIDKGK